MLSFENRIKKKKDFDTIFEKGDIIRSKDFVVNFLEKEEAETRFGIVVSKKVSNKATERNRIKRILRNHLRVILPRIKERFDIVVIARESLIKKGSKEMAGSLEEILLKGNLFK